MPTGNREKDAKLPGMGGVFSPDVLGLFSYSGSNPLRFFDPTGLAKADVERLAKASDKVMGDMWKRSFYLGGLMVREHGATITQNSRLGVYATNIVQGDSGSTNIDLNVGKGNPLLGDIHTHPYSYFEGSHTGIAASAGDFVSNKDMNTGYITLIEAGTKRFAVEVVDSNKFKSFVANSDLEGIYESARAANGGSFQDQTRAGMAAIANSPNSGVKAYESIDKNKLIFQEIK